MKKINSGMYHNYVVKYDTVCKFSTPFSQVPVTKKKEWDKNSNYYYVKAADWWPEELNSLPNSATNPSVKFRNILNQILHK